MYFFSLDTSHNSSTFHLPTFLRAMPLKFRSRAMPVRIITIVLRQRLPFCSREACISWLLRVAPRYSNPLPAASILTDQSRRLLGNGVSGLEEFTTAHVSYDYLFKCFEAVISKRTSSLRSDASLLADERSVQSSWGNEMKTWRTCQIL